MAHIPTVYETYMSDPYLTLQCKEQLENIQADAVKTITNIERLRNMLYRMNILTRQAGGTFISPTSITHNDTWIECFYLKWDTADKSLYKPTHECNCDTTKDELEIYVRGIPIAKARLTDSNAPQVLVKFFNDIKMI